MIFYILIGLTFITGLVIAFSWLAALVAYKWDFEERIGLLFMSTVIGGIVMVAPASGSIGVWNSYADVLAKAHAQEQVITVHSERVESLTARLQGFDYPEGALLNHDTPIAAIVTALNSAEEQLAQAKTEQAKAVRSIEKISMGPYSGVVNFVGSYPLKH